MEKIVIGTRGSDLALWQAHYVQDLLQSQGFESELNIIKTKGDIIQHLSFDKMEGKGFFTKEIESALIDGECDLAIHSFKDLETSDPEGLEVVCMPQRTIPNDILIIRKCVGEIKAISDIPIGAIIGTSSARRKNQWRAIHPNSELKDLRGNVPTRIQKLRDENYDAIILAAAGVDRLQLDLSEFTVLNLQNFDFVPAPAQGALGVQIRANDQRLRDILTPVHDRDNWVCVKLERSVLAWMNGGCHVPLGVHVQKREGTIQLEVSYATEELGPRTLAKFESQSTDQLFKQATALIDQCRSKS
ncbi:MAG: hydroxymethylbilane synthase [Sphingobacteriales bacterium]|jgi:hydroxymethylbilane synthase